MLRRLAWAAATAGVMAAGLTYLGSEARLRRRYDVPASQLEVSAGPAALARGHRIVTVVAQCTLCHGADLGGHTLADDRWLGRLSASNLTPGRGGIAAHTTADLVRAIRYGVGRDGRALLMMPAQHFRGLGDEDLAATIAYLRSLPAVHRAEPPRRVGPLARVLLAIGSVADLVHAEGIDPAAPLPPAIPPEATAAYGEQLVALAACKVCHHADLSGGLHPLALPGEPTPPDLTPCGRLAGWSIQDFLRALRTGATPDGRVLDASFMPWPVLGQLTDLELRAIWAHLRSLPADCAPS